MRWSLLSLIIVISSVSFAQRNDFRIGIIKYKTEEKVNKTFQPLGAYLSEKLGKKVIVDIVDENELAFRLNEGQYDMGIFKPFPYMKAKSNEKYKDLHVFATHEVNGEDSYWGFILSNEGSELNQLSDLQGKKFLFIKPNSTSGFSLPKGVFHEVDIDIEDNFFEYDFTYDHLASLDSLKAGSTDGVAISSEAFGTRADMDFEGLNIISEFEVPYHAYVFSPRLDSAVMKEVSKSLFEAKENPDNAELLENPLHITGWRPQNDEYYNSLRRYLNIIRVKPSINVTLDIKEKAKEYLDEKGDVLTLVQDKIKQGLESSQRFSKVFIGAGNANHNLTIRLSVVDIEKGEFSYEILNKNELLAAADIEESDIRTRIPPVSVFYLLKGLPIVTKPLYNGTEWFISYGTNDGLTPEGYTVSVESEEGDQLEISRMTDLNTYFSNDDLDSEKDVVVYYSSSTLAGAAQGGLADIMEEDPLSIDGFWRRDFWDKVGLFGGILVAVISTGFGWYFNTRKKRRFKTMLDQTNSVLKEFYEDQFKMESKIIELKDVIAKNLESGAINENQFLILKHKIDDVEAQLKINKVANEVAKESGGES